MNDIFGQPVQYEYYNRCGSDKPQREEPQRRYPETCRQLPGTIIRISIPAGATINVLNIVELTSPTGICLILRIPLFGGELGENSH